MFAKITIAIALIIGTASGALAAPKQKHHTNRAHGLYDTRGQHGSASRAKTAHVKTTHARTAHGKTKHAKTRDAQTTPAQAADANITQLQTTQLQPTQSQPTQSQTTDAKTADPKTADPKTGHVKTAHAKTTRAKITRAKQRHRTTQTYASYESRSWSIGGTTSALAIVNPKYSSRYFEFYNTRSQYTGPASGAAATPKHKHSSNAAYDVYDIRSWYIGSDPDPNVRFMLAMDPSWSD